MKHFFTRTLTGVVVLGILLLLGPSPGYAIPFTFNATLNGASENPSNSSLGTGVALARLDPTAHTLSLVVIYSGLGANTTAALIHCCVPPSANGPVATAVPAPPGVPLFPLGTTSGVYFHLFNTMFDPIFNPTFITTNGGTPAGAEAALLAGLLGGQAYFNIHTTLFPGGEIRGTFAQVPESSTLLLLGLGLVGLATWRWKHAA